MSNEDRREGTVNGNEDADDSARKDYDVVARGRITRKIDMGLSEGFDKLKGKHGGFISDRKFLNGWCWGTQKGLAKIQLLWIDGKGGRGTEDHLFEHYFWMATEDISGRGLSLLRKWRAKPEGRRRFRVRRWEVDEAHPQWSRVYVDCPPSYFYSRTYIADRDNRFVNRVHVGGRERRITYKPPSLLCAEELHRRGVKAYEADLNPVRRFVAEHSIRYPTADEFAECYFDIETDDRHDDIFVNLGKYRIISIAWYDKHGEPGHVILEEDTDEAERRMLKRFVRTLDRTDVLFSWNGYTFDYYYLYERCRRLGVKWRWWRLVFADLLPVFKRYHFRGGSKVTSLRLDAIGASVLGEQVGKKVDIKDELDRDHPGWRKETGSHAGTWAAWWYDPDLLIRYNLKDCDVLRRLEEFCGYAHLDFTFSGIGNCFANDYHISTKVDGLMVRKALTDGIHFPTILGRKELDGMAFEGGYVHEPERGVHEDVAAFDFKSLYPSMMTTFNISPDTYVAPEDRRLHSPEDLITTPVGTTFMKPRFVEWITDADGTPRARMEGMGFIPQMFAETLERRKQYTSLQGEEEVGSDMFLHYYRLAYSYKRLGLSFYGELGNVRGRYFAPEVGRSVTLCGQYFIKTTMVFAEHCGYRSLYGDTDSMYVQMKPDLAPSFVYKAQALYFAWFGVNKFPKYIGLPLTESVADQVQYFDGWQAFYAHRGWNVDPRSSTVYLEFEDVYGVVCLINKKRYFGLLAQHKGKASRHLEVKGLEVMRSDGVALGRVLQERVMRAIAFDRARSEEVWKIVNDERERVLGGAVPVEDLVCVKGMSKRPDSYKSPPPHVRVVLGLIPRGIETYVGMKVPYVWTVGTYVDLPQRASFDGEEEYAAAMEEWAALEAKATARRTVPPKPRPVWAEDYDPEETPYDREFYWNNKVLPPTLRIVRVAFPDRDWTSLDTDRTRKRGSRMGRYRKALLDPSKRAAVLEKIPGDEDLNASQREELTQYYITHVLGASG